MNSTRRKTITSQQTIFEPVEINDSLIIKVREDDNCPSSLLDCNSLNVRYYFTRKKMTKTRANKI